MEKLICLQINFRQVENVINSASRINFPKNFWENYANIVNTTPII